MAILVDDALWGWRGRRWAHLVSDDSYEELHAFAARLDIPRRAFQGDHYDIPTELRTEAIALGARAIDSRELVRRLRHAGLRQRQRSSLGVTRSGVTQPGVTGSGVTQPGVTGPRPAGPGDAAPPVPTG